MKNEKSTTIIIVLFLVVALIIFLKPKAMSTVPIEGTEQTIDNCDSVGVWECTSYLDITTDSSDKVEGTGSLVMSWKVGEWGGVFHRPLDGSTIKDKPYLRLRIKAVNYQPSSFKLALITGTPRSFYDWEVWYYEIWNQLIVGSWSIVEVDLRFPSSMSGGYEQVPSLSLAKQLEFNAWNVKVEQSSMFKVDLIECMEGSPIPLEAYIDPTNATLISGSSQDFKISVRGGNPPYSYEWYEGTNKLTELTDSFTFTPSSAGTYSIRAVVTDSNGTSVESKSFIEVLSSSTIESPTLDTLNIFKSEVRAVSVAYVWNDRSDFPVIAQTLSNYGIGTAYCDVDMGYLIGWDMMWTGSLRDLTYHRIFIDECHKKGIKVYASFVTMLKAPSNMRTLTSAGEAEWLDATKPEAREMLKVMVQSLARDYDFDGINFDYVRWMDQADVPLGDSAKTKFIADTGLIDVNWPMDVLEGGGYHWDFLNWRANVITELVGDMYNWAKAVNPAIIIAVTPFECLSDAPYYWVKAIGQHASSMVDKGYADYISPMIYDSDSAKAVSNTRASLDFFVGGSEGKIPMIPWVNYLIGTPSDLVQKLSAMKNVGIDGWILNPYGGPGADVEYADIRTYLTALNEAELMKPIWGIQNLKATKSGNQITVSWTTTKPTTGRVEYSDTELFEGVEKHETFHQPFHYVDVDYIRGTIVESATPETAYHSITIPSGVKFRIQGTGSEKITSKPLSLVETEIISELTQNDSSYDQGNNAIPVEPTLPLPHAENLEELIFYAMPILVAVGFWVIYQRTGRRKNA